MPVGEGGSYVPKYGENSSTNEPPTCAARHECAGGGQGGCDSAKNHGGRHTCDSCQELFSVAGEPGINWCLTPCPRCNTKCRRQIRHSRWHVCDNDHTWSGLEMPAGRPRQMDTDPDFALPLPDPKMISSPPAYRLQDAGDGVDHWHCAHCNTKIPLNSSICSICKFKICNSCSEAKCPKTEAVRQQGERDGNSHQHCAHCGARIPS